jgi:hypothetical protein
VTIDETPPLLRAAFSSSAAFNERERERAAILQEADNLASPMRLPRMLDAQRERIGMIQSREVTLRAELRDAKRTADSDGDNLERRKECFIECLVRSGVPGITANDRVALPRPCSCRKFLDLWLTRPSPHSRPSAVAARKPFSNVASQLRFTGWHQE